MTELGGGYNNIIIIANKYIIIIIIDLYIYSIVVIWSNLISQEKEKEK